jgi:hypothetical protein
LFFHFFGNIQNREQPNNDIKTENKTYRNFGWSKQYRNRKNESDENDIETDTETDIETDIKTEGERLSLTKPISKPISKPRGKD